MIEIVPLPADLRAVAAVIGTDPDGEIERAVYAALRRGDNIGACRLALTIAHPYRRAAYVQNFRPATIAAARLKERTQPHADHAAPNLGGSSS